MRTYSLCWAFFTMESHCPKSCIFVTNKYIKTFLNSNNCFRLICESFVHNIIFIFGWTIPRGTNVTLDHKTSLNSHEYICSNSQQCIVWVKIIYFSYMPKIIRILSSMIPRSSSMKIFFKFPTINISKLNFRLVICIAKDFIWTTLKAIFTIFRFFLYPQIPDFQIIVSRPNIVLS